MVYLPRKVVFTIMLVLGIICLVDSGFKKDGKEFLAGLFATVYAIITLVSDRKKKRPGLAQKSTGVQK